MKERDRKDSNRHRLCLKVERAFHVAKLELSINVRPTFMPKISYLTERVAELRAVKRENP